MLLGADEQYEDSVVKAFQEAYKLGIHRTVHAGENGGPRKVIWALTGMHAERIGHGYRNMMELYKKSFVESKQIHLKACPYSSVMTGSVLLDWTKHPVQWAKHDVNFSVSRNGPTCFDNAILSKLALVKKEVGLTVHQIWKAQLNAVHAAFLPEKKKQALIFGG